MGHIEVDPARMDAFVADVEALAIRTRGEEGCLFYAVAVDDARAGRLLVAERWQDQASLTAHLEAPATSTFVRKWAGAMKSDVRKYDATHERTLA